MKSPQTYLIAFLALTTIGGSILAWQQYGELVALRTAAMNPDERADLQKRAWDLERLNKQLRDQLAAQHPSGDEGTVTAGEGGRERRDPISKSGARGGPVANTPLQQAEAFRELMARPEVQAIMSSQQKDAVQARYAALFKSLNLAPEQAEKLKTILADRQTTMQDVMSAARDQGIDPRTDRNAVQKLMEVARNDITSSIKSVIGESGFNQLETYEKTIPQRNIVNQLQQRLSSTDTPLTSIQADQLVQILAANTPAPPQRRPADTTGAATQPVVDRAVVRLSIDATTPGSGAGRMPDLGALGAVIGGALAGGGLPGGAGTGMLTLFGGDAARGGGNATAPITATALNQSQAVLAAPQVAALQQLQQQQQNQQQLAKIVAETLGAQNAAANANTAKSGGTPPPTKEKRPGS